MELKIEPAKGLKREVTAPPSKSISHRTLIAAALAEGESRIYNLLDCEDCMLTLNALKEFGIEVSRNQSFTEITGYPYRLNAPEKEINLENSGTSLRFLESFACLAEGKTILTGNQPMKKRPVKELTEALKSLGGKVQDSKGFPPVTIEGRKLKGGIANLTGRISSQYISSILLASPYAEKEVILKIKGEELKSKPYIDLTLEVMKGFGVEAENNNYKEFNVPLKNYKATDYIVEGDYSNASYFFGAAAILSSRIRVKNLNPESRQADISFLECLTKMGCRVEKGSNYVEVEGPSELEGIEVNLKDSPDIVPTLAAIACFANRPSRITGVSHLRFKETDRVKAIENELKRIGIEAKTGEDFIEIIPKDARSYKPAAIETYNDHRIAMSFSLIGLKIHGIKIKNPECVKKSFPDYFNKLNKISER